MMDRIITWSVRHAWVVAALTLLASWAGWWSMRHTSLDALPDLSEPQVILAAEWMGQSPADVQQQVLTPATAALLGLPGVDRVRAYAMPGMGFVYAILDESGDTATARARVLEQVPLLQAKLPAGARLQPGPDASGVGWALQYALRDASGQRSLADLTDVQERWLRPALQSVPGVAEVATVGGYQRTVAVRADPAKMALHGVRWTDLQSALAGATTSGSLGVVATASRDVFVQLAGQATTTAALADLTVLPAANTSGQPAALVRVRDVATVHEAPAERLGTAELNGEGEAVGGIVVVRQGQNVLNVLAVVKTRLQDLQRSLPAGIEVVTVYDRSALIERAVATLSDALLEQMLTVAVVILVFLWKLRSALVPILLLPAAVLLAFVPMRWLDVTSNLMSLGGLALAMGDLVDAAVVLVDDVHKKLERLGPRPSESERVAAVLQACKGVGRPIFFSLLLLTVAFLPVFALGGQAGRLFAPLAWTKTLAMGFAAMLSITAAPALLRLLVRGHITPEHEHWLSRLLMRLYRPFAWAALHNPRSTVAIALLAVLAVVPLWRNLGSEFMPALQEGDLLYMPTTAPGLTLAEAQRQLQIQDRVLAAFPEVQQVMGKAGRADTATDPAPVTMIETLIQLRPQQDWRRVDTQPFWQTKTGEQLPWLPSALRPLLVRLAPPTRPITQAELITQLQAALDMAGWTQSFTQPIRTRIDMLSTGVRTPVGLRVYGPDVAQIDAALAQLEPVLAAVPGARSVFYERSGGAQAYVVQADAQALVREGLSPQAVPQTLQRALQGELIGQIRTPQRLIPLQLWLGDAPLDAASLAALPVREAAPARAGAAPNAATPPPPRASDMGAMAMPGAAPQAQATSQPEGTDAQPPQQALALGQVATLEQRNTPAMLLQENGQLAGTLFVDLSDAQTDPGHWLATARERLAAVQLPEGIHTAWTGQYEQLEATTARLQWILPFTLALMLGLLYLQFRAWAPALMVLGTLPFAAVGAVAALWWLNLPLSTAVWVGIVGLLGVAAETGIVMLVYLDEAHDAWQAEGRLQTLEDLRACALEGAVQRVRPKLMTVSMNLIGLAPMLWAEGSGAEVLQRLVAPMVGGLFSSTLLTLEILPVLWVWWRGRAMRAAL